MNFNKPINDPQNYYWYKQGFSKEELDKIYNGLKDVPDQKATTLGGDSSDSNVRRSRIKWIPKTKEWEWLYHKLMDYIVQANDTLWQFELVSAPELIQFTEYHAEDEGHYTWHQDIGPDSASLRKISVTVQLSDPEDYEGGDLQIWQGGNSVQTAERGAGVVFIFPSYMMHRVNKVTKGVRRSFVLWVGGEHYK
jgi:PKHD-type hydroxylase